MKKKKKITKPKSKQKIDIVLESLLNLETVVKNLLNKIDTLEQQILFLNSPPSYPPYQPPQDNNEPFKKYWPNTEPPFKYKDIMWNDNDTRQWGAIENGWQ